MPQNMTIIRLMKLINDDDQGEAYCRGHLVDGHLILLDPCIF